VQLIHNKKLYTLLPIFIIIFFDYAALNLSMPVLTPLLLAKAGGLLPKNILGWYKDFLYGFTLAIYPLFMFFSTPILGDLSDKLGRKKVLAFCLGTSAVSYFICAISVIQKSYLLCVCSLIIAGLAAGTQSIAIATIIDNSSKENRARHIAWAVFTASLGLIIGPALSGIAAAYDSVTSFGYETPFFIAILLSLLNLCLILFCFKDSKVYSPTAKIKILKGFTVFIGAFRKRKFSLLSLLFFSYALAWSLYYQTINWVLTDKFHYSVAKLSLFVAFLGLIFTLTTSILSKIALKPFTHDSHAFLFFIFFMAVANVGSALSHTETAQWCWLIINAICDMLCYNVCLNIFSNQVGASAQGWMMGVTSSIGSITWTISGLLVGSLGFLDAYMPFWVASALCLVSLCLMQFFHREHLNNANIMHEH
jgi:DHA1 family tetracycline resistance protein-like MFS transporter